MEWITITLQWYVYLFVLGIIFFPAANLLLGKIFWDRGYAFAKTIAIICVSYSIFVLSVLKILPFTQISLFGLLLCFGLINLHILRKQPLLEEIKKKNTLLLIIFEEIIFLGGLLVWVYVRGQEPSIRGLEKFMDFGFINSAMRADFFPPKDIWLAGHTINYYYFGHITGAVLTKLSAIPSYISYNLILATIFALSLTQTFSLCNALVNMLVKNSKISFVAGLLGTFITNFGGNLHAIYAFTKGYDTEKPVPFWEIMSRYTPEKYWYPNATRFIPFTIHEFPLYSYVVADLHGHVFDIPFVLLTISFLFVFFVQQSKKPISTSFNLSASLKANQFQLISTIFLGFLAAVHYMTNAFDGPIYMLLATILFFILYRFSKPFFISVGVLVISFIAFSLPFSANFTPFVNGIGVNCAPVFLTDMGKLGPFLFEKGNCQISPWWMLMILWGFFWFNFIFFALKIVKKRKDPHYELPSTDFFILVLFSLSTFLIIIPEFFYIKDIYPAHFRANTMFKLGYQAFIMMSVASTYVFFSFKDDSRKMLKLLYIFGFGVVFTLVAIYPRFAIKSYYGDLKKTPVLDGTGWITYTYTDYKPIIDYLNKNVSGQPTILEAQGDSYTDFNVVSAYTGLPTVAGWWVHEWLWRGSSNVVGNLIPTVQSIYESDNIAITIQLIQQYKIEYIIIGPNERKKYPQLKQEKLQRLGRTVVKTSEGSLLLQMN